MISFSHVPPDKQSNLQTFQYHFTAQHKIIQTAISQTNKKRKFHLIKNPNLPNQKKKQLIQIISNNKQEIKAENNSYQLEQKIQNELKKEAKEKQVKQNKIDNKIQSNKIQAASENQNKSQQKVGRIDELSKVVEQKRQQYKSHIVILSKQQVQKIDQQRKQNIFENKGSPIAQLKVLQVAQNYQRQFQQQIRPKAKNYADSIPDQNHNYQKSHIQCTLLRNYQPQAMPINHNLIHSNNHSSFQQKQLIPQNQILSKSIITLQKAKRSTYDQNLYDSYYLNKNKIKFLGGKKNTINEHQIKSPTKQIKLQITKLPNINPTIF